MIKQRILSKEETLALLSEFAESTSEPMRDRLKAVELLGKMQGFFLDTEVYEIEDHTGSLLAMFGAEPADS